MSKGDGGKGAAVLPPTVDLDEVSLKVAMASYERARVKCLLGHGKALLDWDEQNPALRAQLLGTCTETVKDTVNTLGAMGLRLVDGDGRTQADVAATVTDVSMVDNSELAAEGIPLTARVSADVKPPAPPFAVGGPSQAATPEETRDARMVPLLMAAIATTVVARRYVHWAVWPWSPLAPAGRLVRQSVQSGLERTVYR